MGFKSFYRYLFVLLLLLFGLIGCGGGGGSSNPTSTPTPTPTPTPTSTSTSTELELRDNVHFVGDDDISEVIGKFSDGKKNIIVSDRLGKTFKVGNVLYIPAGIDNRFPLGLSGKIENISKSNNGNSKIELSEVYFSDVVKKSKKAETTINLTEDNFIGVIAPSAVTGNSQNKYQKYSKSFLNGGIRFIPNKSNKIEKSFLENGEVSFGTIALNVDIGLKNIVSKPSSLKSYGAGVEPKVIVSGSISDLKLIESHDMNLINRDLEPYIQLKTKITGKLKAEVKFQGKAEAILGTYNRAWQEVEKEAIDNWAVTGELTGISADDKIGKYPIAGLVFQSPIPVTYIGKTQTPLRNAKTGGFIVWVYINANGKISIDGEVGVSTNSNFKMGINKPKDGEYSLVNEIASIKGERLLEAPFIDGEVKLTTELGLSLALDTFMGGIRVATVGLDAKGKYEQSFGTNKKASYGIDKLGDDWSWKGGQICRDGSAGLGMLFNANVKLGVDVKSFVKDANINLEYTNQYPTQENIDKVSSGWVNNMWYVLGQKKECFNNKIPTAENQSIVIDKDKLSTTFISYNDNGKIKLKATDTDGDILMYRVTKEPSHGTLSGTAPNLIYTPNSGYGGEDSFKFLVNDGFIDSEEATVSIWIISKFSDKDGDGMTDVWELQYPELDINKNDAKDDYDEDGVSNYQEFLNGTNPTNSNDFLKFNLEEPIIIGSNIVTLKWNAINNATYYSICISEQPIINQECTDSLPIFAQDKTLSGYRSINDKEIPFESDTKYYAIIKAYSKNYKVLSESNEQNFIFRGIKPTPTPTHRPTEATRANFNGTYSSNTGKYIAIDTSTSASGICKWYWEWGDNLTDNIQNPIHYYSRSGTYKVKLTVTDCIGNTSSTTADSFRINLSKNILGGAITDEEVISIKVRDFGKIDGDRISVWLNDKMVFNNVALEKYVIKETVVLKEGENKIKIYAHNEGTISPNTAEITFDNIINDNDRFEWKLNTGESAYVYIFRRVAYR